MAFRRCEAKEGRRKSVWVLFSVTAERLIQVESDTAKFLRGEFPTAVYCAEVLKRSMFLWAPWLVFTSSVRSGCTQGFIRLSQLFVGICVFTEVMKKSFQFFVRIFFWQNFPCTARSQTRFDIWILLGEIRISASSSPQLLGSLAGRLVGSRILHPLSCSVLSSSATETAGASRTLRSGQHVRWLVAKPRLQIKLGRKQ